MMRWLRWLWIPLVAAAVVVAYVVGSRKGSIAADISTEIEVIEAKADARRFAAQLGAENARRHVEERYEMEIASLNEHQQASARAIRDRPDALAEYIIRTARNAAREG